MITRPALVAASLVTSWSPAKAEIIGQPFTIRLTYDRGNKGIRASIATLTITVKAELSYLNSLSIVGLHNMEVEAVHPSSWCQEDTALLVKMSAHVHQDLSQQAR